MTPSGSCSPHLLELLPEHLVVLVELLALVLLLLAHVLALLLLARVVAVLPDEEHLRHEHQAHRQEAAEDVGQGHEAEGSVLLVAYSRVNS